MKRIISISVIIVVIFSLFSSIGGGQSYTYAHSVILFSIPYFKEVAMNDAAYFQKRSPKMLI